MTLVLREPPFNGLRVVRELEPQDPEGNRGAKTQRTPSINEITNSKLEIRNSKQIQMIKKHKIPENFVLDFDFWI